MRSLELAIKYLAGNRWQGTSAERPANRAWTNPQSKYTISGNQWTRDGTTGWDGYVTTANGDLASANPSITEITRAGGSSEYIAFTWYDGSGLPRGQTSGNWNEGAMAYGWYFTSSSGDGALVRIDGVTQGSGHTYTAGTSKFKIEMTSADVKFYEDVLGNGSWSLKYTANSGTSQQPDASKTYYMIGASSEASATMEGVNPTLTGKLGSENIIYEESDTGKHYIWDGSSTWNEIA